MLKGALLSIWELDMKLVPTLVYTYIADDSNMSKCQNKEQNKIELAVPSYATSSEYLFRLNIAVTEGT